MNLNYEVNLHCTTNVYLLQMLLQHMIEMSLSSQIRNNIVMDDDPQCYSLTNCFGFFSKVVLQWAQQKRKSFPLYFVMCFFSVTSIPHTRSFITITLFFSLLLCMMYKKYATIKTSGLGLIQGLWIWV